MSSIVPDNSINNKVDKLQEELLELNKLFDLARILGFAPDINALADKLIDFLETQYDAENTALFVLNNDTYRLFSYKNLTSSQFFEFENQGEGIWQIIETGKPFQLTDESGRNIYSQFFENYNLQELNSYVWVPFIYKNKVLAILSLGRLPENRSYDEQDLRLLAKISDYVAPAISKLKEQKEKEAHIDSLQKTLHNISILYNVGQAMNFIDDLKKLLKLILGKAIQTIGAEKGSLMLYDAYNNNLSVKVVLGLPDKEVEDKINEGLYECTKIAIGEGIAGNVFASKKAIITNLGAEDPRFKQSVDSRVSSILCVPLIVKGEAIGVINITNKQGGKFFNQDDLDFMGALANQAAIAINNAQLYELATKDGLTKLYIYRHFHYLFDLEIKRSGRYQHSVSLLMMDIDNFKSINDTYGHQIGDEILKEIANVISMTCRKIDMPCRYGGEEFALILPETQKENARKIAERLRSRIESVVVKTKENSQVSPTISIGISCFPEHGTDQETLIEAADKAMYFAKHSGKNCVAEFDPEGCIIVSKNDTQA